METEAIRPTIGYAISLDISKGASVTGTEAVEVSAKNSRSGLPFLGLVNLLLSSPLQPTYPFGHELVVLAAPL